MSKSYLLYFWATKNLVKILETFHIFRSDFQLLNNFLACVLEPEIFTEIKNTHDRQNIGIFGIFCLEKDRMRYLIQQNQVCHTGPMKMPQKTSTTSTILQFYPK